jgi:hypothetical protein
MAINPLIALSVESPDFSKGVDNAAKIKSMQADNELKQLQAANAKIEGMDLREKSRFDSVINGAAGLNAYLEAGDIKGAENFLLNRKKELGARIAAGEDVDTRETDETLAVIKSGDQKAIETLKGQAQQLIKLGQLRGTLKTPLQIEGKQGGSSSVFAQTMSAIDSDPELAGLSTIEKIRIAQNKIGTNLTFDKDGNVTDMAGAAQGLGNLEYGKETGNQKAKNENEPSRAGDVEREKLEVQAELEPSIQEAIAIAKEVGSVKGEAQAKLNAMVAQQPRLEQVANELSELGKTATYTTVGRGTDAARRELGLKVGEGAVNRKEYIAKVDNEVLPLLRQTFGAQFTVQEGESLRKTLGDPNASPEEKDAVLRAFIASKVAEINSLKAQTGSEAQGATASPDNIDSEIEALEKELGIKK